MGDSNPKPYSISPINEVSFSWLQWAKLTEEECLLVAMAAIEKARISSQRRPHGPS